jgi:DNA-binding NarL/FixJ family response regulator
MPATVLIAEKNKYITKALRNTLSCLGFDVVETTSNRIDTEAMAFKIKPDLLLYDMHLSNNGRAALADLKRLKKQLPKTKILVTSFHEAGGQFATEILNDGFDGFWSKFSNRGGLIKRLNVLFPTFTETHCNLNQH